MASFRSLECDPLSADMDNPERPSQAVGVSGYRELLDATIGHLEDLQSRGLRHVQVSSEVLSGLVNRPVAVKESLRSGSTVTPAARPSLLAPVTSPVSTFARPSGPLPSSVAARWNTVAPAPVPKYTPAPTLPLPPKLTPEAKLVAVEELRRKILSCVRCPHLVTSRKTVVFGVGDIHARLMFVGEAPGADEDAQGEPFVGKAGELLTRIITAMGLSRSQVFIANILKCRPDTPGQTAGNRKPTSDEMGTCIPWLQDQINLIQPEAMVALGATAVEGLLGKTLGITKLRGSWQEYRGIPLMPTYHPAYLLRNQAPSEKRKVWEDMMAVMERLQMPISEKQRGYFLTK